MRDILRELGGMPGVRGAAVVLSDGVVVAAELAPGSDPDSFAALFSSLLSHVRRNVTKLGLGGIRRAMVTASRGRFAMTDVGGEAYLVAEIERHADPSAVELELESAASRLRREMRPSEYPHTPSSPVPAPLPYDPSARA
ncbi:MAG TPA: roadblock/LC7 domain-containing protein [Planctomycetota bacterium]|nr:roadblock/LC7 domain-containing protein [Planctomycetota bacterium]